MISYAQNFEDVLLNRIFKSKKHGFYIDVGAHDPEHLSVTKHFYDLGWRGINIEPVPESYERLANARPEDVNLNVAVGEKYGLRTFYQTDNAALSSFDKAVVEEACARFNLKYKSYKVEVRTLKEICKTFCRSLIDFLKVDVEGFEAQTLRGADFEKYRPVVVVVESTAPNSNPLENDEATVAANWAEFEPIVIEAGYEFAYFDGLNRYYLRNESLVLKPYFSIPIGLYDDFVPASQAKAERERKEFSNALKQQEKKSAEDEARAAKLIETLGEDKKKVEQWARELESKKDKLEQYAAELIAVRGKLEKQTADQTKLIEKMGEEKKKVEQWARELESKKAKLEEYVGHLQKQNETIDQSRAELYTRNGELTRQIQVSAVAFTALEDEKEKLLTKALEKQGQIRQRLWGLEGSKARLEEQVLKLQSDLGNLQIAKDDRLEPIQDQLAQQILQNKAVSKDVARLRAVYTQAREDTGRLGDESDRLRERVNLLAERLRDCLIQGDVMAALLDEERGRPRGFIKRRPSLPPSVREHAHKRMVPLDPEVALLPTIPLPPENEVVEAPTGSKKGIKLGDQLEAYYGRHRSGWAHAVSILEPLRNEAEGIYLETFIERRFYWHHEGVRPIFEDWVGIIHVPGFVHHVFDQGHSNEAILSSPSFQRSLPFCRGIFTMSEHHKRQLQKHQLGVPIEVLYHPTEFPERKWSIEAFEKNLRPKIVQLGWWMRNLHAIFELPVSDYEKIFIRTRAEDWFNNTFKKNELARKRQGAFFDYMYNTVTTMDFLSNEEYDHMLAENICFLHLYDASANNSVIECMARNTPLLVNPISPVVEYLGQDYPFYYSCYAEAVEKAKDKDLVFKTHEYLKSAPTKKLITAEYFLETVQSSPIMKSIWGL